MSNSTDSINNSLNDFHNNLFNAGKEKAEESESSSWSFVYESFSFKSTFESQLNDLTKDSTISTVESDADENLMKIESNEQIAEENLPDVVKSLITHAAKLLASSKALSTDNILNVNKFQRIVNGLLLLVEDYGSFDALESISEIKDLVGDNALASGTMTQQFQYWFSSASFSFTQVKSSNKDLTKNDYKLIQMTMQFQMFTYLEKFNQNGENSELVESIKETDAYDEAASLFSDTPSGAVLDVTTVDEALELAKAQTENMPETVEAVPLSEIESSSVI